MSCVFCLNWINSPHIATFVWSHWGKHMIDQTEEYFKFSCLVESCFKWCFHSWVRKAMDQFSSYWCKHTAGQWPNDAFCLYNFFYNEFSSNSHIAHMGRLFSVFWTLRIQQKYVAAFALNLLWINQNVSHFQYERKASPCRGNHQKLHLQQYLFWCWIVVFLWNGK